MLQHQHVIEQQHLKTILGRLQIPEYLFYKEYMPLEYKLGIKYQSKQHKNTTLFHGLKNNLICTSPFKVSFLNYSKSRVGGCGCIEYFTKRILIHKLECSYNET